MSRFVKESQFAGTNEIITEGMLNDMLDKASKAYEDIKEKIVNMIRRLISLAYDLYTKISKKYREYTLNSQTIETRKPVIDIKKYNLEKLLSNTVSLYNRREAIIKQMVPFVTNRQYDKCLHLYEQLKQNTEEFAVLADSYKGAYELDNSIKQPKIKMKVSDILKLIEYWKDLLEKFNKSYNCFLPANVYNNFLKENKNKIGLFIFLEDHGYDDPLWNVFYCNDAVDYKGKLILLLLNKIEKIIKNLTADIDSYKEFGRNVY